MQILLFFAIFFLTAVFAKGQSEPPYKYRETDLKATTSGLKYAMIEEGTGMAPPAGDFVVVHYIGVLSDGKQFESTYEKGPPLTLPVGAGRVVKGLDEALSMLKVGSKAVVVVPPELAYGAVTRPNIPPNSPLIFHVDVLQSLPKVPYVYDSTKAVTTESGLKYIVIEEGDGPIPQKRDRVVVHYLGLLADGKKFDSSFDRGEPFKTAVGMGAVIRGWDEAFTTLKVGTRAVLIIPPELGYGDKANGGIPPSSTLYFHVQLLEVTPFKPYEGAKPPWAYGEKDIKTTETGLKYVVIESGKGKKPKAGQRVEVYYHGIFENGKVFDSSYNRDEPIEFPLGAGMVIKGWEEALPLFKEGARVVLIIPPGLGYGEKDRGGIPGNSTLYFYLHFTRIVP